jgi:hypothetical protein
MSRDIRETTITPGAHGDIVQIRISDAPLADESASFQLTILAKVKALQTPTVAHLQREAMKMAQETLTELLQNLMREIQASGYGAHLPPRQPAGHER